MTEREYDRKLNIKTVGIREPSHRTPHHNRYEATPYRALEKLFQTYKLNKTDQVVDFGCGRGRVLFYIHHRFHVPVTGIEANDKTFEEALHNKARYRQNATHICAPIQFEYGLAEDYKIQCKDNRFYFFNPFSIRIFKKVVNNIVHSVEKCARPVELIFYYPLPEFKQFLKSDTPFKVLNKVHVPGIHGRYGKFIIYRIEG